MKKSGLVIAVLVIVALGFLSWYIFGRRTGTDMVDRHTVADSLAADSIALGFGVKDPSSTSVATRSGKASTVSKTPGATMVSFAPAPAWATRDIHDVPLGTILDYAVEVVEYDDDRGRGTSLKANSRGQAPFVTVTPAEGVWGMTRATMAEGHIVARIQSDGDYADLGLASGLNFLWVGNDPEGNLEWVLVPGTAFAPLKDLSEADAGKLFRQHSEVSSIPVQIRDF